MMVRPLCLGALAAAVLGGAIASWPSAARAADAAPVECAASANDSRFTSNKRLCLEKLVAHGLYQDVVDRIETQDLGLPPQEKYFLGKAYFGLSNRTAAHALKCHYTGRARDLLEGFLTERQELYRKEASFGTTDDIKYVSDATKVVDALKTIRGCEQSAHTETSLERYARRFASQTVEGLFYKDGSVTDTQLVTTFNDKTKALDAKMNQFVEVASRVESRYGTTLAEIDAGKNYLLLIQQKINGQFASSGLPNDPLRAACANGVVTSADEALGTNDRFPKFLYRSECTTVIFRFLENRTVYLQDLVSAEKGGRIGVVEKKIRDAIGAQSIEDYAKRKEKTYVEVTKLSSDLLVPVNFGVALKGEAGPGKLTDSIGAESPNQLYRNVRYLKATWRDQMKDFCTATSRRWYCGAAQ